MTVSPWWWVALAILLGAIEMLTPTTVLVWSALAALVTALALWLAPARARRPGGALRGRCRSSSPSPAGRFSSARGRRTTARRSTAAPTRCSAARRSSSPSTTARARYRRRRALAGAARSRRRAPARRRPRAGHRRRRHRRPRPPPLRRPAERQRKRRRNARMSPTRRSGASIAAKWPPRLNSDQCMTLCSRSANRRIDRVSREDRESGRHARRLGRRPRARVARSS